MILAGLKRGLPAGAILFCLAVPSLAQTFSDTFAGFGSSEGEPIEIEASELQVEDRNKIATFSGDVVVIQGETRLETQRLKVYYDGQEDAQEAQQSTQPEPGAPTQQEISRLEALGGVNITSQDQRATGDSASFDMAREVMVMTGREVVLVQGANVVVGNHLTVNLKTGQANLRAEPAVSSGQNGEQPGRVRVRILPNSLQTEQ